jgi:hypothetical protein
MNRIDQIDTTGWPSIVIPPELLNVPVSVDFVAKTIEHRAKRRPKCQN